MSASEGQTFLHSITHTSPTDTITNSHNMFLSPGLQSSQDGSVSGSREDVDRQLMEALILHVWKGPEGVADDPTEVLSSHTQGLLPYLVVCCVVTKCTCTIHHCFVGDNVVVSCHSPQPQYTIPPSSSTYMLCVFALHSVYMCKLMTSGKQAVQTKDQRG